MLYLFIYYSYLGETAANSWISFLIKITHRNKNGDDKCAGNYESGLTVNKKCGILLTLRNEYAKYCEMQLVS